MDAVLELDKITNSLHSLLTFTPQEIEMDIIGSLDGNGITEWK